ncbi:MAG: hypothetical protein WD638_02750 [Nitriliruptoraceae bacterium]
MNATRVRIDASRLSEQELAVVGATVTAVLAAPAPHAPSDGATAWRRAGLLEAARRGSISSPTALELARRR